MSTIGSPLAVAVTLTPTGLAQFDAITLTGSGCPAAATKPWLGESIQTSPAPAQCTAADASSRPPLVVRPPSDASASLVRSSSAFMPSAVASGKAAFTSAAAPATNGVAIDVPSSSW